MNLSSQAENLVENQKIKSRMAFLSVCSNTFLVLGKFAIGIIVGSVSILSEAIHSCMDLIASGVALFAVKTSELPPDEEHPYGHGRIENVSSMIEALLILAAGAWIVYESVHKMLHPEPIRQIWLGVGIMLASSLINLFVARGLFKVGRKMNSPALLGDAWHLMTDVWTSAGVMIGLACIWIGSILMPNTDLNILDPIVGFLVAMMIVRTGINLLVESVNQLMDQHLPPEEEHLIQEHLIELKPITRGYHKMKSRKVGSRRYIEFHLKVDGDMALKQVHALSHQIQNSIEEHLENCSVSIHFEPCTECAKDCLKNCVLTPEEREQVMKRR